MYLNCLKKLEPDTNHEYSQAEYRRVCKNVTALVEEAELLDSLMRQEIERRAKKTVETV